MLLSEHLWDAPRPDAVDEGHPCDALPSSVAARELDALRGAIAALSVASASHGTGHDASPMRGTESRIATLVAHLHAYHHALMEELTALKTEGRSARARAVLREHVSFVLNGLVADLRAQRTELRSHGEVRPVLQKTWCLALATSVAIEHLADDLARFHEQPRAAR